MRLLGAGGQLVIGETGLVGDYWMGEHDQEAVKG